MQLRQLDLNQSELQDMLEIAHEAMGVSSDEEMHRLLLRVRTLVPCEYIIAFLGETGAQGNLKGVAKLVNVSFSAAWLGAYLEKGYATVDPVLLTHFRQFESQLWSETFRRASSAPELDFMDDRR